LSDNARRLRRVMSKEDLETAEKAKKEFGECVSFHCVSAPTHYRAGEDGAHVLSVEDQEMLKERVQARLIDVSGKLLDVLAVKLVEKWKSIQSVSPKERMLRTRRGMNTHGKNYGQVEMTDDGTNKIKHIPNSTEYYFGDLEDGCVESGVLKELSDDAFNKIGKTLDNMKQTLQSKQGSYLGKDVSWWREKTTSVLDPSVLVFDPDAKANVWLDQLKSIRSVSAKERTLLTRQGKDTHGILRGQVKMTDDGTNRIKHIQMTTQYYFGDLKDGCVESGALKELSDDAFDKIGTTFNYMKIALQSKQSLYFDKDVSWWREKTASVLHPSVLAGCGP